MKKPYSRSGIRFYITWIALILNQYTPATILSGTPILLLGAVLHLWAKGCLYQDDEVTQSGPYRFVRHPFYLAYLFNDIGIVIMSGSWLLAAVFPVWWLAIYIPTIRKEEAFLEGLTGKFLILKILVIGNTMLLWVFTKPQLEDLMKETWG